MPVSIFVRLAGLCAAAVVTFAGSPALAEWRRAESPRFIVYSQGSESALRGYVQALETYDFILRARMGLALDQPPARKLPIYLVGGHGGLVQINPRTGPDVAGTYFPVGEDIFAAAFRDRDQDFLLHEYFHHFSAEVGVTSFPGWMIEGLAEYFMTAEIKAGSVEIGGYNQNRANILLNQPWLPLEELLTKRPGDLTRQADRDSYYPVAWLLTHWFMSDDTRRAQLSTYTTAVLAGGDPAGAMEQATGMTLAQVRQALRRYLQGRLPGLRYEFDRAPVEITVTRLPRSADDLLLLGQRLKVGVDEDQRAATAELVRRAAAGHPDDPFALLQLAHAELHFGNAETGETILARLLEIEPRNVEALQLMASRQMALAQDRPDESTTLLRRARGFLGRAYEADNGNYYTLYMIARTRVGMADYPTENDLVTWDLAHRFAPQLASIRLGYASALMDADDFEQAIILLRPLANAPHGGGAAEAAQGLLERARAGQAPLAEGIDPQSVDREQQGETPGQEGEPVDGEPVAPEGEPEPPAPETAR